MDWHVLHLRPRTEKKVAGVCGKNALEFYLPLRRETKVYQRRKVTVDKPVFPGYLFVSFDHDGRLELLKTNNIVRILEPPNQDELLRDLAQVRLALGVDPTLSSCSALRLGTRVRITGGPFMGIEGVVEAIRNTNKVRLNVDLIGRAVAVDVDRMYLEVID